MSEKPQLSLVSPQFIRDLADVLMLGNDKYGKNDWMNKRTASHSDVVDAALRHITAYELGEDKDPESGKSHLIHAVARLMILHWYITNNVGLDDRLFKERPIDDLPF